MGITVLKRVRIACVMSYLAALSASPGNATEGQTVQAVETFVYQVLDLYDRQSPSDKLAPYFATQILSADIFGMKLEGWGKFAAWYQGVDAAVANSRHIVEKLEITNRSEGGHDVMMTIRLEAVLENGDRFSQRVSHLWTVVTDDSGALKITRYIVTESA